MLKRNHIFHKNAHCFAQRLNLSWSAAVLASTPRPLVRRVLSLNSGSSKTSASEKYSGQQAHQTEESQGRPSSPAEGLNERQREAALTAKQHVRVKAGPGTGKTRVVVARAHHLITSGGVSPRRILAITFTNKAALELRERLEAALGPGGSSKNGSNDSYHGGTSDGGSTGSSTDSGPQVLAKTFHGLGAYLLRRSLKLKLAPALVSKLRLDARFKVLDADQSCRVLKNAIEQVEEYLAQHREEAEAAASHPTARSVRRGEEEEAFPELARRELNALADILGQFFSAAKTDLAAAGHHDDATAIVDGPKAVEERLRRLSGQWDGQPKPRAVAARLGPKMVQRYFIAYHRQLRRNNAVDFADLICLPVRLLDLDEQLRDSWRSAFDHILVDEFQDTDPAQYKLVRLLLSRTMGLFVVGDPDQAIYSWRGAQVTNMTTYLSRDFPSIATYHLSVNYRSVLEIVACADAVLQYGLDGTELYERQVAARSPAAAFSSAVIRKYVYSNPEAEARAVAKTIDGWVRDRGGGHGGGGNGGGGGGLPLRGLDRVAVLYRRRDQSRQVEEELTLSGVPYVVVGGQPFWSYKEIADAVAYLHLVLDPLRSDVMLERIINEPTRGLGPATVDGLRHAAAGAGVTLGGLLFGDFCGGAGSGGSDDGRGDGAPRAPPAAPIPPAAAGGAGAAAYAPGIPAASPLASVKLKKPAAKGVQELRGLVCRLRSMAAAGASVERLVNAMIKLSGCEAVLMERRDGDGGGKKTARAKQEEAEEADQRLERLQSLGELAARPDAWLAADDGPDEEEDGQAGGVTKRQQQQQQQQQQSDVGLAGLARFLEHAALVTGADADAKDDRPAVRLMTLHASKGLEFQWVFILGLEDGILPSHRTDDKDEERRLFYVGVTRAEDRLFLSRCEERFNYEGGRKQQPSPFLAAIGS